jgi:hypothetical protein
MHTNLKILLASMLAAFVLAGCGGNGPTTQAEREQQLEDYAASFGVNVDVELDDASGDATVTINTGVPGVTSQTGTNVAVPDGFPGDIAIHPDMRILSANAMPQGYMIQGQVAATPDEIADFYIERMTADGWTDASSRMQPPTMRSLNFEKGNRMTGVNLLPGNPNTTVQVTALTRG